MDLAGKKITIFGMGKSGLSALKLAKKLKAQAVAISQGAPENWPESKTIKSLATSTYAQDDPKASEVLAQSDFIVISPGIPTDHFVLKMAHENKVPLYSEIEFASWFVNAPIIAVTGTNGKTTTVSLMGEILRQEGKSVFVGGNIGLPFCEAPLSDKNYDVILLELSSFQLETIERFHPHIALILNITPNHGERYQGLEDYSKAKFQITKNMNGRDFLFYDQENSLMSSWAKKQNCQSEGILTADILKIKKELNEHFDLSKLKLQGTHNLINLTFAWKALDKFGVSKKAIQKAIEIFNPVDHRLQLITCVEKFTAINDAKSTNWSATLSALSSLEKKDKKLYLILGGKLRGKEDSSKSHQKELCQFADKIFLIGESASLLYPELENILPCEHTQTLEKTLAAIRQENFEGIVLFSPAYPSFDQFKDYVHRGETFISLLKKN